MNQYETEAMMRLISENGYEIVNFDEIADIYIINTCTVTREAERKSKQMLRKAIKKNNRAKIFFVGCSAQSCNDKLRNIPGISYILGNYEKNNIIEYLQINDHNYPIIKINPIKNYRKYETPYTVYSKKHTRALVKIQDGCNNFCTYCKIPYVRGPERSRSPRDIIKEIQLLEKKGIKEIVLLGINLGTYEYVFENSNLQLTDLICMIEKKCKKIERIRLSSIEVNHINGNFIELFRSSHKLCHHLHIPLQSGSDKILKLMNRPYVTSFFSNIIDKIRKVVPNIALTTDVMVGFPGESQDSFEETCHFIEYVNFTKLHVFPFSEREECLSKLLIDKADNVERKIRMNRLLKISKELRKNYLKKNQGITKKIIIESIKPDIEKGNIAFGMTDNFIQVKTYGFPGKKGDLIKVKLMDIDNERMIGKVLQSKI